MIKSKKWIKIFIGIIAIGLALCLILVCWIDPFFQYHAPLEWFPYQIDNQNLQNPGMARNMDYDAIIIGSSVSANFYSGWFDEDFDCNSLKLTQNAACPKDYLNIMEQVDLSKNQLKYVFWTLEPLNFVEADETAYEVSEYLYDTNPFNDMEYQINLEVITDYIVKPLFDSEDATDIKDVYETHTVLWYGKEYAMEHVEKIEKSAEEYPGDYYLAVAEETFDKDIAPIIENHKDTIFYIPFVPYSIMRWYSICQRGMLEAEIARYKYIIGRLLEYDNVNLYFFTDEADIITDMNRYADTVHFDRDVSYFMEQSMHEGTHKLNKDNYAEVLEAFKSYLNNYDYESVWN